MTIHRIKNMAVLSPVPFDAPIVTRLDMKHGVIEFNDERGLVLATAHKTGSRQLVIPLSNIAFMEIATSADLAPKPDLGVVKIVKPTPPATPAPDDKVVFEKDADGRIVERKKSKT